MLGMLRCGHVSGESPAFSQIALTRTLLHAVETLLGARCLPHRIATQVKTQTPAGLGVFNLIFNLSARDEEIACDARGPRAITGADLVRHYYGQHAGLDALADSQS
jgi:hypothetical protein